MLELQSTLFGLSEGNVSHTIGVQPGDVLHHQVRERLTVVLLIDPNAVGFICASSLGTHTHRWSSKGTFTPRAKHEEVGRRFKVLVGRKVVAKVLWPIAVQDEETIRTASLCRFAVTLSSEES
jgi:hypothetical protein